MDSISLWLSLMGPWVAAASLRARDHPTWWTPNIAGHRRLLRAAGFEVVEGGGVSFIALGEGYPRLHLASNELSVSKLALRLGLKLIGAPSTWALARPRRQPA
jgi:hypothetical protein